MQRVQLSHQRNGDYGWSIAHDVADPELWTERYHCPTWPDYLRQRNRASDSERVLQRAHWNSTSAPSQERPIGSVRLKDRAPDPRGPEVEAIASGP